VQQIPGKSLCNHGTVLPFLAKAEDPAYDLDHRFFARANDVDCSPGCPPRNRAFNGCATPYFESDSRNFNKEMLVG
jgi:hypothetical protein